MFDASEGYWDPAMEFGPDKLFVHDRSKRRVNEFRPINLAFRPVSLGVLPSFPLCIETSCPELGAPGA